VATQQLGAMAAAVGDADATANPQCNFWNHDVDFY
jgi:hypothetical protein